MDNNMHYMEQENRARRHKNIKTALKIIAFIAVAHVAHKGYKAVAPKFRHADVTKHSRKAAQSLHHLPNISLSLPSNLQYKTALDSMKSFITRCKQKVA